MLKAPRHTTGTRITLGRIRAQLLTRYPRKGQESITSVKERAVMLGGGVGLGGKTESVINSKSPLKMPHNDPNSPIKKRGLIRTPNRLCKSIHPLHPTPNFHLANGDLPPPLPHTHTYTHASHPCNSIYQDQLCAYFNYCLSIHNIPLMNLKPASNLPPCLSLSPYMYYIYMSDSVSDDLSFSLNIYLPVCLSAC